MKKGTNKVCTELWKVIASLAMVITTISVNITCMFEYYQPKLPQGSEKLRRE
ncbi:MULTISPECIES: cyclic lactone autoinducer peptide [Anaerotignum]|uniref:cyclic lactone autoinducer peptide n=1 Tax=Anaerotignum TaxID=2039240 RepID=UPI0021093956|nr:MULTISPECIES: cyclic lactone autoinducer peptide [Anaerotignum]MCQ4937088.1 cyclic lactone autoinducer peptide [Anaerotignum propionicum]